MPNMLEMMKQFKQLKKMQKELASRVVESSSGDGAVRVAASADMRIKSIKIDPGSMNPSDPAKLEALLVTALNGALDSAKKVAASDMSKLAGGLGGLSGMLGG
jgi:DNA-binding YbaB/EbfC family protein